MGKYIITILLTYLFIQVGTRVEAQNNIGKSDDLGRIILSTYIPSNMGNIPSSAKRMLKSKLDRISSKNGLGGNRASRFVLVPSISILSKDITPTAPVMTVLNLDVTFFVGDAIDGILYSSTTISVKGVGRNETKAYTNALKRINVNNPNIADFLNTGKEKIIKYYNTNCDFFIKKAETQEKRKEYDSAIASLLVIPEICKECFDKCQDLSYTIYKSKMENECSTKIQKSKLLMAQKDWDSAIDELENILPDISCYDESQNMILKIIDNKEAEALANAKAAWSNFDSAQAAQYLGLISVNSKYSKQAIALGNTIHAKIKADEDKEWDYKLKKEANTVDLEHKKLEAMKEIGVAYGNNQPNIIYDNINKWLSN